MLGAAVAWAQSGGAKIILDDAAKPAAKPDPRAPAPAKPPASKVDPNKAPAQPDAKPAPKKDDKKKEDEIGKIDGMEIARGTGFMGLQIVNGTFKLSFYDAKKKPVKPDVVRAAFRWNVNYQKQPERAILTISGTALVSEKIVKPPFSFKLFMTLFKEVGEGYEASDAGAENLTVDYSQ
jgi:hypothetical protein